MNRNATEVYEKGQLAEAHHPEELHRLADEILSSDSPGRAINPELAAKLSQANSLDDISEELYPAVTELFAYLLKADTRLSLLPQVRTNG